MLLPVHLMLSNSKLLLLIGSSHGLLAELG